MCFEELWHYHSVFSLSPLAGGGGTGGGKTPLDLRLEGLSPLGRHQNLEKLWRWISIFSSKNVLKMKENSFREGKSAERRLRRAKTSVLSIYVPKSVSPPSGSHFGVLSPLELSPLG